MKTVKLTLAFIAIVILGSCEKWKDYPCDSIHTERVGAICKDGERSEATGSGACSNHGGVSYWLCN